MTTVLDRICTDKRVHVDAKIVQTPLADIKARADDAPPPRGFINAIENKTGRGYALITEVKKASPSKGVIRADFDPAAIARIYEDGGATCLSVLTDEKYFQGSDDDFRAVRSAVSLPMLRKDFMIDAYQIYESRVLGADCVLLIMAALSDSQAADFYALATALGMDVLVEVHDQEELERAFLFSPKMIGVNNRNLKTLDVNLQTGLDLARKIPDNYIRIAESGLHSSADLKTFAGHGYHGFLIGESLMKQDDIAAAMKKITAHG
jgi:indole-3-glycerol phosphate synthase